jgi:chemotaxis protein MotA
MDIATILGIAIGVISIGWTILSGNDPIAYYDLTSIAVVLGGGIASVLISYRMSEVINVLKVVAHAFTSKRTSNEDIIRLLVRLSQKARREGLLALESEQEEIDDPFIKQSLQLIVDGVEPEMIRDCMGLELTTLQSRHERGQGLFKTAAALFPAWGMIGTLMGLINLLKGLTDAANIGPAMALALVTTFYGAILAYFICQPIANKLKVKSQEEILQKEMIIEGILSIQAGENPRLMEYKLKTFLSPKQKKHYDAQSSLGSTEAGRSETAGEPVTE